MATRFEFPDMKNNTGKFLRVNASETDGEWVAGSGGLGYSLIQDNGSPLTPRFILNARDGIIAVDDALNTRTDIYVDIAYVEANSDLANIGGFLDLSTQVTNQLSSSNIDLTSLSGNVAVSVDGVTITGDGTTGNPLVATAVAPGSGYTTVQDNGTSLTQRAILNFSNLFNAVDNGGASKTDVDIDIAALEPALDLANISGQINLATQVTGLLPPANIDITNLQSTLDLGSIAGQIDLTTQVTGTLGLSNGGTGASLTDPNYDAVWVWDDTTNTTRLANISGLTYNSGTNTLTASGGGTGTALETTVSQTGHGLSVGDVIKVSGTNTFAKAQADTEVNSETVGVVTTVVNANSFKYVSSAIQLAYAPVGTPGSAVWLDPTVAGGMTTTKPSTIGQVARALGTIIESGVTMYFDIAALAEVIGSGGSSSMINNPTYEDDFLTIFSTESTTNNLKIIGSLNFRASASSPSTPDVFGVDAEANHPGIIQLGSNPSGSAASMSMFADAQGSARSFPIPNIINADNEYQFIVKPFAISALANAYIIIERDGSNGDITVRLDGATGNIQLKTFDGTTTTTTTVGAYSLGTWYNFKVVINGSAVDLYQNGVLVATNTTNIPPAGVGTVTVGTSNGACLYVDYFAMKIANLTR
jgi:hypothetical protein